MIKKQVLKTKQLIKSYSKTWKEKKLEIKEVFTWISIWKNVVAVDLITCSDELMTERAHTEYLVRIDNIM